jgi:iron-sulfur cluster repair protein YtfE (RIC family)
MKTFEEFSQVNESSRVDHIWQAYPAHMKSLQELLALIQKEQGIHSSLSKDILIQIIQKKF